MDGVRREVGDVVFVDFDGPVPNIGEEVFVVIPYSERACIPDDVATRLQLGYFRALVVVG